LNKISNNIMLLLLLFLFVPLQLNAQALIASIENRVIAQFAERLELYHFTKGLLPAVSYASGFYLLPKAKIPFADKIFEFSEKDMAKVRKIFGDFEIGLAIENQSDLPLDYDQAIKEASQWIRLSAQENLDRGFALETFDHNSKMYEIYLLDLGVLFETAAQLQYRASSIDTYGRAAMIASQVGVDIEKVLGKLAHRETRIVEDYMHTSIIDEVTGQWLLGSFLNRMSDPANSHYKELITETSGVDFWDFVKKANEMTPEKMKLIKFEYFRSALIDYLVFAGAGLASITTKMRSLPESDPTKHSLVITLLKLFNDYNAITERFLRLPPVSYDSPLIWEEMYDRSAKVLIPLRYLAGQDRL
jgi:hypothetical protein